MLTPTHMHSHVYMHTCLHTPMHSHMYVHACSPPHMHTVTCTCTHTTIFISVHTHAYANTCTHLCAHSLDLLLWFYAGLHSLWDQTQVPVALGFFLPLVSQLLMDVCVCGYRCVYIYWYILFFKSLSALSLSLHALTHITAIFSKPL